MASPNSNTPLLPTKGIPVAVEDADFQPSGLYVGTAGVVSVIPADQADNTPRAVKVSAGGYVPCMVRGIRASGTTAADLFRVW